MRLTQRVRSTAGPPDMRDFRCPGLFHRHGLEYKTLNGVRIAAKRKSEEALNIMIKAIIFIKPLKNNVGRGKAQRLASGSGVPTAGAAGAAEVRCSVKAPSAGLGWDARARPGPWHLQRGVSVTPELVWQLSVSRRADAARGRDRRAGKQHSTYSTCAPGPPDWCAPLKGLVLEASSCACHR